jgi:cytochrome c-type biogenesis protein CcmF
MTKLSPFAMLPVTPPDGAGLNPLLADPWMVIHPPVMFMGYAMAAVPFALAIAAMMKNDYSEWIKRAFPWAAMSALLLGAGNILGGFWAYKTLGWGGYWAWDPVENSSFVPWMVSLALLHGLLIERRTGALRKTNLLISALLFLLVVYGTFLTRSGVLSDFSVHSFVDLGINNYLVGFMAFFFVGTAILFATRAKGIESAPLNYNFFGRDFSLLLALVLLMVIAAVVLFWSSLPLLTTAFSDSPRAAETTTYNEFAIPLASLVALFVALSPFFSRAGYVPESWKTKLATSGAVSVILAIVLYAVLPGAGISFLILCAAVLTTVLMSILNEKLRGYILPAVGGMVVAVIVALILGVRMPMYLVFIGTAALAAVANVHALAQRIKSGWHKTGGPVVHFGFGVMLIGILASSAFNRVEKLAIPIGGSESGFDREITYWGMENDINVPKNKLVLTLNEDEEARPELYLSQRMGGLMRKPHIEM